MPGVVEAQLEAAQVLVGEVVLVLVVVPSPESLASPRLRGCSASEKRPSEKAWHKSTRHRLMDMFSSPLRPRFLLVNWVLRQAHSTRQLAQRQLGDLGSMVCRAPLGMSLGTLHCPRCCTMRRLVGSSPPCLGSCTLYIDVNSLTINVLPLFHLFCLCINPVFCYPLRESYGPPTRSCSFSFRGRISQSLFMGCQVDLRVVFMEPRIRLPTQQCCQGFFSIPGQWMHWPILHGVWSGSSSFCQEFPLSSRRGLTGRVACEEVETLWLLGMMVGFHPIVWYTSG